MEKIKRARARKNHALGKINHQKTFTLPGPIIKAIQDQADVENKSASLVAAGLLAQGLGMSYEDSLRLTEPALSATQ